MAATVSGDMLIGEILQQHPETAQTLMAVGMHCLGCPSSQMESLNDACLVHGLNPEKVLEIVNEQLAK